MTTKLKNSNKHLKLEVMTLTDDRVEQILLKLLDNIQLPKSAYETAVRRYKNLGEWYMRADSSCSRYEPEIFSQGSFRLGTATLGEHYDLDLGCKLNRGVNKGVVSQKQLKAMIGRELQLYHSAHNLREDLEEKQRCWRMTYADELSFHMDIVPCIPESEIQRNTLKTRMLQKSEWNELLASEISSLAVSITDNQDPNYAVITPEWLTSNPQGYARWFEFRMRTAQSLLERRAASIGANIEDMPLFSWRSPLQGAIQLLKQHRNIMFEHDHSSQPISIIITTLAARSYSGETSLAETLERVLASMEHFVSPLRPHIPNPINSHEDFADKWYSPAHKRLNLEQNFHRWLIQAKADFSAILRNQDAEVIIAASDQSLGVKLEKAWVQQILDVAFTTTKLKVINENSPQPWFK